MKQLIISLGVLTLAFAGATFADTSNSNTGAGSTNNASQETNNQTNISNINDCFLNNDINSGTNTGNNQTSGNTGSGSVNTGNTSTDVNVNNNCNEIVTGVTPASTSTSPSSGKSTEILSGVGVSAASGELPQTLAAAGPSNMPLMSLLLTFVLMVGYFVGGEIGKLRDRIAVRSSAHNVSRE